MYFGTWVDVEGNYFDKAHFSDCLEKYPFQGEGCYYLFGTVEVDFHFPNITIQTMEKMPFIHDSRYAYDYEKKFEVHQKIKDITFRKPYAQEHEIGLPRMKIK